VGIGEEVEGERKEEEKGRERGGEEEVRGEDSSTERRDVALPHRDVSE
jgi:hypothetical protein